MGKIQELSTLLTNQIAAGEVIERPSSVVKELIENAIDANSTHIEVLIEEAGLKKIQVIDNGDGMLPDDVLLAFKRHATSKLYAKEDLFRIRTLGFRGEALPSIASVSQITLETSTGQEDGTYVLLHAGQVIEHRASHARKGTSLSVENLFYNTPARLKFVKTLQTEIANISDMLNRLALSHPNIAFSLVSDGNQLLKTVGNGQMQQTIAGVYSPSVARQMRFFEAENLDFKVHGYVSLPEVTRASKNYMSIFINGRYIKNYAIANAIVAGYQSKLMIGRFPIAVIAVEMDYALVDVNVHPTKQQVRISKEAELAALVSETISQLWQQTVRIPTGLPKRFTQESEQTSLPIQELLTQPVTAKETIVEQLEQSMDAQELPVEIKEQPVVAPAFFETIPSMLSEEPPAYEEATHLVAPTKSAFPELHYFGQMHGTYLFAENQDGLYIIDQHAAQERIKYEYYRIAIGQVADAQQGLLVPLVLDYPMNDYLLIKERQSLLADIGIHLQLFGQHSFLVEEHPNWIKAGEVEKTIRDLITMLLETGKVSVADFREDTAIMMSCKGSIKANHHLSPDQARQLLVDLAKADNPYNCPHGRPVMIQLTNTDMEKMFKRIQDR